MGLFSILPIVREHYKSLVSDSSKKRAVIIFGVIPTAISIILILSGMNLTRDLAEVLIPAIAILIGFSINAMLLLIGRVSDEPTEREEKLVKNTRNHTMYAVILGLATLVIVLVFLISSKNKLAPVDLPLRTMASFLIYFLIGHYIISLYLLPARFYAIAENINID
ncbi:hypothetical protein HALLA_09700 [Halostagnicola larsenii XH-48]|uniref:Uncharacterized protein n=1 Tax=Halostagnicola larsenii XH-48 TaxID=797299 RepID=W0JUC8_9EURY|nr:hypothetical protein [Halostagnicola larsenii]AHG00840.1 hypothetical protein HALLA_09535 [Halostagnicola larsenii XH-48]AHG00859.1 hypothetical protein HALLA_09700 [Halostagnicola larsenii XH-48]